MSDDPSFPFDASAAFPPEVVEGLEASEMAQDVAAYREAASRDDGYRVSLAEMRRDSAS